MSSLCLIKNYNEQFQHIWVCLTRVLVGSCIRASGSEHCRFFMLLHLGFETLNLGTLTSHNFHLVLDVGDRGRQS